MTCIAVPSCALQGRVVCFAAPQRPGGGSLSGQVGHSLHTIKHEVSGEQYGLSLLFLFFLTSGFMYGGAELLRYFSNSYRKFEFGSAGADENLIIGGGACRSCVVSQTYVDDMNTRRYSHLWGHIAINRGSVFCTQEPSPNHCL